MDEQRLPDNRPDTEPKPNTGADFVRILKPVGAVVCLLMFILLLVVCFLPGNSGVAYEPMEIKSITTPQMLADELSENLLPQLDGVVDCSVTGDVITITTTRRGFAPVRRTVLHYYDPALFEFVME